MNLVDELLGTLEQAGGLFRLSGRILPRAVLDHFVDQLRVEKTLLARLGLVGPKFQRVDALLIGDLLVEGSRAGGNCERKEEENQSRFYLRPHDEPPQLRVFAR